MKLSELDRFSLCQQNINIYNCQPWPKKQQICRRQRREWLVAVLLFVSLSLVNLSFVGRAAFVTKNCVDSQRK